MYLIQRRLWLSVFATVLAMITPAVRTIDQGDLGRLNAVLGEVTGQLEKFNGLYINKLERELSATSSRLSAVESTLRAVADRALAWDNIQNHMAVWTDQTRTMEKKLDMLNRCHEKQEVWTSKLDAVDALNHKLTALDKKINTMTRLEFKVEKVSERIEEIYSRINTVHADKSTASQDALRGFDQLAKRGLVSYLSNVEEKLENISKKIEHNFRPSTFRHPKAYGAHSRGAWTMQSEPRIMGHRDENGIVQCYLPLHNSRMLEDVSAKVDLLFDRMNDPDYDYNTLVGHLKRQAPSTKKVSQEPEFESAPEHIFARFWKSLFAPFKKMNRRFRTFEAQLNSIQRSCNGTSSYSPGGNFGDVVKKHIEPLDAALREEMSETRVAVSDQSSHLEKMAQMMSNAAYVNERLQSEVTHQFEAQRAVTQTRYQEIRNLIMQYCTRESGPTTRVPTKTAVTAKPYTSTYIPAPTLRNKRPSYSRSSYRTANCLPKDSPLWNVPSYARTLPICLDGARNNHRFSYRVHNSKSTSSKRHARNHYKNSILRNYRNKSKRDIRLNEANYLKEEKKPSRVSQSLGCSELYEDGKAISQVYEVGSNREPNNYSRDFYTRYCDQETDGGGWTVIQRRGRNEVTHENFTRSWDIYKYGFGDLMKDFWWGNDFIHRLSNEDEMTLRFDLWDFEGNYAFAEYLSFKIADEENSYKLEVSGYHGNASDSFSAHNGYLFSTYDMDNDEAPECCPCAPAYGGGWWFYSCFESNLNGEYHNTPNDNAYYRGLIWELWLGDYSLKATEIKIRPASFSTTTFPTPFPGPFNKDTLSELP